jgi:membrane protease subunit HflK
VVNRAKGDADRFNSVLEAYKGAPSVTARRMYLETMEDVLKNANTIVMGSGAAGNVLPYLSLDKVQKSPKLGEIPQATVGEAKP